MRNKQTTSILKCGMYQGIEDIIEPIIPCIYLLISVITVTELERLTDFSS